MIFLFSKIFVNLAGVSDTENIYNWNMMGKRGNIVQTFPAIEYDFTPRNLQINRNDLIHIQWTGSNTHNNQGGGDGQAGDDGEGTDGLLMKFRRKNKSLCFL
jgi:hypothetical protein